MFGDDDHTEYEEINDIEDCFRMQCKQIFIGMVTMQYQAKTDMVSNKVSTFNVHYFLRLFCNKFNLS